MKWYSIKKHKQPLNVPCLINSSSNYGMVFMVAKYQRYNNVNEKSYCHWWFTEDSSDYTAENVTHFLIIDPIEIEE